jgi:lysozyme
MADLKKDEGFRSNPYQDTEGVWTVGYGRNLDDVGLSEAEATQLLKHDMQVAIDECVAVFTFWPDLNDERQEVLVNMMLNMGRGRLLGFKKMLAALEKEDYTTAAFEMLDSRWARQVKSRAVRLSEQMRTGEVDG